MTGQAQVSVDEALLQCISHAESILSILTATQWRLYGPRTPATAIQEQLSRLVTEIMPSCGAILKTIQNAKCHVHRLPVELLANIIYPPQHLVFKWPLSMLTSSLNGSGYVDSVERYGLLRQVCRRWKSIVDARPEQAIVFTARGSRDPATRYRSVKSFLGRSATFPLDIVTADSTSLGAIAAVSGRLRRLQIICDVGLPGDFLFFDKPVPLLECLDIRPGHNYDDGPSILPELFSLQAPRLYRLKLGCFLEWQPAQFSTLTHLHVEGLLGDEGNNSISPLLGLLRHNPALQVVNLIALDTWLDQLVETHEPVPRDEVIYPTQLRHLYLSDCTVHQVQYLFRHLHLPPGVSLAIVELRGAGEADVFEMFTARGDSFENLQGLHSLATSAIGFNGCPLSIGTGPCGSLLVGSHELAEENAISSAASSPFSGTIREVWLDHEEYDFREDGPTFPDFPALEKLVLSNCHIYVFQEILRHLTIEPLAGGSEPSAHPPIRCRNLRTIFISDEADSDTSQFKAVLYHLLAMVESRHAYGCPIRHIRLHCLHQDIVKPMIKILQQYVDTVEVDVEVLLMEIPVNLGEDSAIPWPRWNFE
ncbi:hypothetical protein EIP91_007936 [Steccherinum ochraceum]|uniref:F-box domain-containing protein n=1 Tax=Steccherinum ochraceum TaxID=92696 RepID=A0A4R0RKY5_9APHY|nr:hypothetical protein EIP91_007936 [Steccherinum ochraceum]